MAIDTSEINNLLSDPANVSLPIKVGAVVIVFCAAVFAGYKLVIIDQLAALDTVQAQELEKRKAYEKKQARANQLPAYKAQLEEMQISFGALKDQLPSDTEIPGLILDISEKGLSNGLEIELFQPEHEDVKVDPSKKKNSNSKQTDSRLSLKATIKTYRYLSEDEVDEEGNG